MFLFKIHQNRDIRFRNGLSHAIFSIVFLKLYKQKFYDRVFTMTQEDHSIIVLLVIYFRKRIDFLLLDQ